MLTTLYTYRDTIHPDEQLVDWPTHHEHGPNDSTCRSNESKSPNNLPKKICIISMRMMINDKKENIITN
jgi:hypothetical protein